MKNKICVYAICKNEEENLEAWLNSMSEADYIVVLDTGSTDKSFEILSEDKRVYRTERQIYDEWRFEVARNDSMYLIPEDANILVCTDIDEIFEPGWAEILRKNWKEDTDQAWYKYVWSHNEDGSEKVIFFNNKIHGRSYYWKFPVHETLFTDKKNINTINLYDDPNNMITLHHYQKYKESRNSYLPGLKTRVSEAFNYEQPDYISFLYLTHQYYYEGLYEECIKYGERVLDRYRDNFSNMEIGSIFNFIGESYLKLNNELKAENYFNMGITNSIQFTGNYISSILLYQKQRRFEMAEVIIKTCDKYATRSYNWLEKANAYDYTLEMIKGVNAWYLGRKLEGLGWTTIAKEKANGICSQLDKNYELMVSDIMNSGSL